MGGKSSIGDGRVSLVHFGNKLLYIVLLSVIEALDEGVLRLEIRVAQDLIEPMSSGSR